MPFFAHFRIQIAGRPGSQVTSVFIWFSISIPNRILKLLENILVDKCLPNCNKSFLIADCKRNIFKCRDIVGYIFPNISVSARRCLYQSAFFINKLNSQSISFSISNVSWFSIKSANS